MVHLKRNTIYNNMNHLVQKRHLRKRVKYNFFTSAQFIKMMRNNRKTVTRSSSLPGILGKRTKIRTRECLRKCKDSKQFLPLYSEKNACALIDQINKRHFHVNWTVYRCQVSSKEESCCCSCNSDAMFEVMKSLYDCYKKKNCDNCKCILCSHLPLEAREKGIAILSETDKKEKLKKALTDMVGKTPEEKERILRELAMANIPLPEPRTPSETNLIKKVRKALGLPPEPENIADRAKLKKAENAGIGTIPLEGKSPNQKHKILKDIFDMGVSLPEGRTPSEIALINQITGGGVPNIPSDRFHKAKTPQEKEKILKEIADQGQPFPEGKTPSEIKLINKVRADLGLPPEPTTPSLKEKYNKAGQDGVLLPLEGNTLAQKEKILQDLFDRGIPLPEGRTPSEKVLVAKIRAKEPKKTSTLSEKLRKAPSEKALIAKIKEKPVGKIPSEKMHKAKAAGLLTPLAGKTPEQKEKILRGLAMAGLPLPEGKSPSEKKLIDKVRADVGLPPEPKTPSIKEKYNKAANEGTLVPLEGKTPAEKEKILRNWMDRGIPFPEGRTPSEKALIAKIKGTPASVGKMRSEKLRKAKAVGLLTPLTGKTPEQKEKILRGLAMAGLPLPEGKTPSEKKIIDKVRADLGLPQEPKTPSLREKYNKAFNEGIVVPLEGKTLPEKQKILQDVANRGIPLPEGRTSSEKSLIAKIKMKPKLSSDLQKAKAAGIVTPLTGKTPEEKEQILRRLAKEGRPFPDAKTPSEKKLIDRIRAELGAPLESKSLRKMARRPPPLPPVERKILDDKTAKVMREGKGPADECICGLLTPESERSVVRSLGKALSDKIKDAKVAGFLTPLDGKTPEQKEQILKGLAKRGLPLPESKTDSERQLIDRVRAQFGLPPEPRTPSMKQKYAKAQASGLLTPLNGKTPTQKEKILRALADRGIPLPEGRTPSEKALIAAIKGSLPKGAMPSTITEKKRKTKLAGILTPLEGKTPEQKEKILRGLAKAGLPFPEGKSNSDKELIRKIKSEFKIPDEGIAEKLRKARAAGLITPLSGKSPAKKEKILRDLAASGLPLPEPKSPSDAELIAKVKTETGYVTPTSSDKLRKAEAAGLLTPLAGKTPSTVGKLVRARLAAGLPLPDGSTPSEKSMINREKLKYAKAAGLLTPLKGKTPEQKEKILRSLVKAGLPLPEAKSPSDIALVNKIRNEVIPKIPSKTIKSPSEKLKRAKAAGLITPLSGKTPEQKEKNIRGLARAGLPLPEGKTASEKKLINKVRAELGLPPEPKTPSEREKLRKAYDDGLITPLEGKNPKEKEKLLNNLLKAGIPLPEGNTPSEKALIKKVKGVTVAPSKIPSEKLEKARAAGLLTPLDGKTTAEKEKILRDLAEAGLPLPEGKTPSEKSMIHRIRTELGIPPPAFTPSEKEVVRKAKADGFLTPLAGKTKQEKEKILKGLAEAALPLPVGTTPSEKSLIRKIRAKAGLPSDPTSSEKRGKIKMKTKKVGSKKTIFKGEGQSEEFEEIVKTTKCDRACGCDKKKIKFKHSYVKIRVTSPDLSSICPCPDECFPPIKTGVITDNEGIKVTVGSVIGVPSFSNQIQRYIDPATTGRVYTKRFSDSEISYVRSKIDAPLHHTNGTVNLAQSNLNTHYYNVYRKDDKIQYIMRYRSTSSDSDKSLPHGLPLFKVEVENKAEDFTSNDSEIIDMIEPDEIYDSCTESSTESCSTPLSMSLILENCYSTRSFTSTSTQALFIVKTETSLCLTRSQDLSNVSLLSTTFSTDADLSSYSTCYILC